MEYSISNLINVITANAVAFIMIRRVVFDDGHKIVVSPSHVLFSIRTAITIKRRSAHIGENKCVV